MMLKAFCRSVWKWARGWATGGPHFRVGDPAAPYLHRYYLIPRNPLANAYLHRFLRDDEDRALHDHPWPSLSVLLRGSYLEELPRPDGGRGRLVLRTWNPRFLWRWLRGRPAFICRGLKMEAVECGSPVVFRWPSAAHRVELPQGKPAWTLFLTGPRVRNWGFHCRKKWVPWQDFVAADDHGNVGKGCGEHA